MGMHHSVPRGKRVHVILHDGKRLVGKFLETTDRRVSLLVEGRLREIPWSHIRAFSKYRSSSPAP